MISRPEADHIAGLLRTIRPHWDHLAIMTVLTSVDADLADIAYAAIRTAQDPAMRTPQSLAFTDSQHWRPTVREHTPRAQPVWEDDARLQEIARCQYCDEQGRLNNGHLCAHEDPAIRAQRAHDRAQAARAAIRPASRPADQESKR
jgi:hypothetical protein